MKLKNIILGLGLSLLMNTTFAQGGLEGIVVERYYQTDAADGTNASTNSAINALATGTVVYRVYVDMAAGYKFSQLYGASTHDLKLNTTTNFYNDPNYGSITNPAAISLINARKNTALIDSWFTAGGVCAGKSGILKTEDIDGSIGNTQSILANNPASCYGNPINGTNAQDGLVNSTSLTAVNPNILGITSTQLNLLDQGTGNSFLSNNGSIAALGGVRGTNASNMVLVGQFTTNGILSFELNVQIVSANGTAENWVARNRVGNEFTSPSLIFSSLPVAGSVSASVATMCSGASSLLSLTGNDGTIQWQRSTTSATTGFTDILGASASTFNATNIVASTWYRAKVSKSSCSEVFTTAVAVTVNNPSAPLSTAQTFCSETSPTVVNLTATGTAIQWYSASTGGTALSNATALASGNYFASQTVSGCEGTNRTLTAITVNTTPSAPTAATQDFCAASLPTVANLAATGTAVQWYSASTGGVALLSTTALATGNYFASQTVTGCESTARTSVAVSVSTPVAGTVTASLTSICTGTSTLLTLAGHDGLIQWERSITSSTTGYTEIAGATSSTYNTDNLTASTWFRAKVSKFSCAVVYTVPRYITVTTVLAVGGTASSSNVNLCTGTGTTVNLVGNTGSIIWQLSTNWTAATPTWSTVSGQTTTTLTTGNLISSRAYRALLVSGSCRANSNPVVITVSPTSVAGVILGSGSKCINSTVTLSLSGSVGSAQWQEATSATGTFTDIPGATNSTFVIPSLASTRYFKAVLTSGACAPATTTNVATVTAVAQSVAGTVTFPGSATMCLGTTKALTLSGSLGTRQWESSIDGVNYTAISGAILTVYTAAPTVSTYYRARVTNSICSTVYTTPVYLIVSPLSAGGTLSSNTTVCTNTGTTLTLSGSVGTIVWQSSTNWTATTPTWTTIAGQTGTTLPTGNLTASRAYRAVVTSSPCSVSNSNTVVVTVSPNSVAGVVLGGGTKCINSTVTLSLSGAVGSVQWQEGTSATGTFTDIVGETNPTFVIPSITSIRYFKAVLTSGACAPATTNVATVTPVAQSVAGTITFTGVSEVCSGTSKTFNLTGVLGNRQWESSTDGVNYTSIAGAIGTSLTVTPTVSTYYRVRVTNSVCSTVYTTPVYITISAPAVGGNLGSDFNACATGFTLNLTGSNGSIVWQWSTNWTAAIPSWSPLAGQTSTSYTATVLNSTRAFRAVLTSGACVSFSNQVVVTRDPALITKSITSTTTSGTAALTALCTNDLTKVLNLGTGSAGNIQWQVSTDNGVTYTDIVSATTATYTIDAPVDGKNMFRVRLSNACGTVFSSNVFTVFYTTCGARTLEINTNASFGAIAYPNPFADNFMLEVSASTNEMIQVNVYDMLGKLVENHQVYVSDLSTFVIGKTFVSGVYNIEVIQGTQIERLRVVKN